MEQIPASSGAHLTSRRNGKPSLDHAFITQNSGRVVSAMAGGHKIHFTCYDTRPRSMVLLQGESFILPQLELAPGTFVSDHNPIYVVIR